MTVAYILNELCATKHLAKSEAFRSEKQECLRVVLFFFFSLFFEKMFSLCFRFLCFTLCALFFPRVRCSPFVSLCFSFFQPFYLFFPLFPFFLVGRSDSDWAGDSATRQSVTGNHCNVQNVTMCNRSLKQTAISLSSCEAEFYAASACAGELLGLTEHFKELHFDDAVRPEMG